MNAFIAIAVGFLAILFRKQFAKLVMWYHRRRWYHRKKVRTTTTEYPREAWTTSNRLVQVYAVIIGVGFIIWGVLSLSGYGGIIKTNVIYHSEEMAAQRALEFARNSLINKDYEAAYELLSKKLKNKVTSENLVEDLHLENFPTAIRATHFEPMLGQEMMYIFLYGEKGKEEFYYRIIMEGTKKTDYKVFSVHCSKASYPSSKLRRPLKKNVTNSFE